MGDIKIKILWFIEGIFVYIEAYCLNRVLKYKKGDGYKYTISKRKSFFQAIGDWAGQNQSNIYHRKWQVIEDYYGEQSGFVDSPCRFGLHICSFILTGKQYKFKIDFNIFKYFKKEIEKYNKQIS